MIGTMAGMAVYDMITDDKGNQVKVEPYYVSGEQRIPVGTGTISPATAPPVEEETSGCEILAWIVGIGLGAVILISIFSSNV